jgi:hypothetical protein
VGAASWLHQTSRSWSWLRPAAVCLRKHCSPLHSTYHTLRCRSDATIHLQLPDACVIVHTYPCNCCLRAGGAGWAHLAVA